MAASSRDPYGGKYCKGDQRARNESAYYTHVYNSGIQKLRHKTYADMEMGVPLEYFEFERIIVDEIHESLCTSKSELKYAEEAANETGATGFFKGKHFMCSGFGMKYYMLAPDVPSSFISLATIPGTIEKNRRAGRELLGITERDVSKRPLRFRRAIFGLTGTPLLDNCNR